MILTVRKLVNSSSEGRDTGAYLQFSSGATKENQEMSVS